MKSLKFLTILLLGEYKQEKRENGITDPSRLLFKRSLDRNPKHFAGIQSSSGHTAPNKHLRQSM